MTETDTKLHWHDSAIKKVEWWWPKIPSKEIHYWMVWKLKSIGIERKGKKVWFAKCKMSYFEEEPSFWFPPLYYYHTNGWKTWQGNNKLVLHFHHRTLSRPAIVVYVKSRNWITPHLFSEIQSTIELNGSKRAYEGSNLIKGKINHSLNDWILHNQFLRFSFSPSLACYPNQTGKRIWNHLQTKKCFRLLNK